MSSQTQEIVLSEMTLRISINIGKRVLGFLLGAAAALCLQVNALDAQQKLSVNLNGISDWSTQHPFLDHMKTARPWIGHLPGQWGGIPFEQLMSMGALDEHGWPVFIPVEATAVEALIFTDQHEKAVHLAGRYHLFYEGSGKLSVTGRARTVTIGPGEIIFEYTPGEGLVGVRLTSIDATDPVRNIKIVKEENLIRYRQGEIFNPLWISIIDGFKTLRFMGWTKTNNSPVSTWDDMAHLDDFSFAWRGVPLDTMIDLANLVQASPWFNIPHLSDDDLIEQYAAQVFEDLDPALVAHVEYSNEMWNHIFDQAHWAAGQSELLWGELGDGWMQFYGLRAAQVMEIWARVYEPHTQSRLMRVVATHTAWPGLEESIFFGDNVTKALSKPPHEFFDAYAVTGYFGYELGNPKTTHRVLESAEGAALLLGKEQGLTRVALREFVKTHRFDKAHSSAAEIVRHGSFKTLTTQHWPHHFQVAQSMNLKVLMYEGGSHAAAEWAEVNNERLVEFLNAFNYSNEMGELYTDAITSWRSAGGEEFNVFVDVAPESKWGSWGALRHLNDQNPKAEALRLTQE